MSQCRAFKSESSFSFFFAGDRGNSSAEYFVRTCGRRFWPSAELVVRCPVSLSSAAYSSLVTVVTAPPLLHGAEPRFPIICPEQLPSGSICQRQPPLNLMAGSLPISSGASLVLPAHKRFVLCRPFPSKWFCTAPPTQYVSLRHWLTCPGSFPACMWLCSTELYKGAFQLTNHPTYISTPCTC